MLRHQVIHPRRSHSIALVAHNESISRRTLILLWLSLVFAIAVLILLPSASHSQTIDDYPLPPPKAAVPQPALGTYDLSSMALGDQYQTNDLLLRLVKIHRESPLPQRKPMCGIAYRQGQRYMDGLYMVEGQSRRIGKYEVKAESINPSPDGNGIVRLAIHQDKAPALELTTNASVVKTESSYVPLARRGAITRSLRTGQSIRWGGIALRLVRINGEACSIIVRTSTQSASFTLEEFSSVFVDSYEIIADSIRPSGRGRGSATLTIRYSAYR